jgi:hypothetical protein
VADRPDIDLVTLETVHRLLSDTDFASVDDLAAKGGLVDLHGVLESARSAAPGAVVGRADEQAPLPRRR